MVSCGKKARECTVNPIDTRPDTQKMFLKGSVRYLDESYTQYGVRYTYHYKFNELGYLESEEFVGNGEREYLRKYIYDETGYNLLETDIYTDSNDTIVDAWIIYDTDVNGSLLEISSYAADSSLQFTQVYKKIDLDKIEISTYMAGNRDSLSRCDVITYDEQCRKIKSENLFPFTTPQDNWSEFVYYGDTCREDFYFNGELDMQRYVIGKNSELPNRLIIESDNTVTDIKYSYNRYGDETDMVRKVTENGEELLYETKTEYDYDAIGNWIECIDTEHTITRTISYYN